MDGRVHGYQCEIETSQRKWAGGIYDEARRGWLYPLTRNKKGQDAFENGTWNAYRIEAIGSKIITYVNGIQASNLIDEVTSEGFIAFQVHGISNPKDEGKKVQWRNIRVLTTDLENNRMISSNSAPQISYLENKLTNEEKRLGFRMLWDGKSTQGWRGVKLEDFPNKGWVIENGILTVEASNGAESRNGGDIVTLEIFRNFELNIDFLLTEGANSGIKSGVRGKKFKGIGQWNNARILVKGGKVEHWLNHIKVVEYNRFSQVFEALVEKSKYEKWNGFGRWPEGVILLQDHGDKVSFKNIKIREF